MSTAIQDRAKELFKDAINESGIPATSEAFKDLVKQCNEEAEAEHVRDRDQRIGSRRDSVNSIVENCEILLTLIDEDELTDEQFDDEVAEIAGHIFQGLGRKLQDYVYKTYRTTRATTGGSSGNEQFQGAEGVCNVGAIGIYARGGMYVMHRGRHKKFRISEDLLVGTTFEKYIPGLLRNMRRYIKDSDTEDLQIRWRNENGAYHVVEILGPAKKYGASASPPTGANAEQGDGTSDGEPEGEPTQ